MRRAPGLRLLLDAAALTIGLTGVAILLVLTVSAVDRGGGVRAGEVAALIGPVCAAAGVCLAIVRSRTAGSWHAWTGLGVSPTRLLAPLALVAIAGALLGSGPAARPAQRHDALAPLALPAPVPPNARQWPTADGGWAEADLGRWQVRPSELSLRSLWRRAREAPPVGARAGVDRAELVRRAGWVVGWLLAVALGCWRGLARSRTRRRGGQPGLSASAEASALVLSWLLLVLVVSAYVSMITR